jgi:hypothetical protein
MTTWTVIDEQRTTEAEVGDDSVLDPSVLGWELKPEGLCRGEVCVPLRDGRMPTVDQLGQLLGRPSAIDVDERVVAFAASPDDRAGAIGSGLAPDFELPDLDGVLHRLSDHQGRKVVLYAYASW